MNLPEIEPETIPQTSFNISTRTLLEIERWAEKAKFGKTKNAFSPILNSVRQNGENLDNAIHALTLAQIMPYSEMIKSLKKYRTIPQSERYEYFVSLAKQYSTSMQNVVDRLSHVRILSVYSAEKKAEKQKKDKEK